MNHIQPQNMQNEFEFSEKDFQFLAKFANEKTGIVLTENKKAMVYGRLARRLRALNLDSFSEYCDLLQSEEEADEISNLINAITTNLTSFFREAHHFQHLKNEVLAKFTGNRLRIWSSACSSGMEPYSIAMVVKGMGLQNVDAKILATDIDSNMVSIGRNGVYTPSDVDSVPAQYKECFKISQDKKSAIIKPEVKELITFNQLNLLESWPMKGQFDIIFCRNVVIYFNKPTKQALFERMANLLKPGGWLYIGHSENLIGISDRFESAGCTIYRRVK